MLASGTQFKLNTSAFRYRSFHPPPFESKDFKDANGPGRLREGMVEVAVAQVLVVDVVLLLLLLLVIAPIPFLTQMPQGSGD